MGVTFTGRMRGEKEEICLLLQRSGEGGKEAAEFMRQEEVFCDVNRLL